MKVSEEVIPKGFVRGKATPIPYRIDAAFLLIVVLKYISFLQTKQLNYSTYKFALHSYIDLAIH